MPHCVIGTLYVKEECDEELAPSEGLSDVGTEFDQVVSDSPSFPEPRQTQTEARAWAKKKKSKVAEHLKGA